MQTSTARPPDLPDWVPECVRRHIAELDALDQAVREEAAAADTPAPVSLTPGSLLTSSLHPQSDTAEQSATHHKGLRLAIVLSEESRNCIERLATDPEMRKVYDWLRPLGESQALAWFQAAWLSVTDWSQYREHQEQAVELVAEIGEKAKRLASLLRQLEQRRVDGLERVLRLDYLLHDPEVPEIGVADVLEQLAQAAKEVRPHHSSVRLSQVIDSRNSGHIVEYLRAFALALKNREFPLDTYRTQAMLAKTAAAALDLDEVSEAQVSQVFKKLGLKDKS